MISFEYSIEKFEPTHYTSRDILFITDKNFELPKRGYFFFKIGREFILHKEIKKDDEYLYYNQSYTEEGFELFLLQHNLKYDLEYQTLTEYTLSSEDIIFRKIGINGEGITYIQKNSDSFASKHPISLLIDVITSEKLPKIYLNNEKLTEKFDDFCVTYFSNTRPVC